jgi:acyl carrier protein
MERSQQALEILSQISGRPVGEIRPEMHLTADLGIESPQALQLLLEIETALGLEIPDEDAALLDTVEQVLDYVSRTP